MTKSGRSITKMLLIVVIVLALVGVIAFFATRHPTNAPSPSATTPPPTVTSTPTPLHTVSPNPTPLVTPTSTPTASPSPTPAISPTPALTPTPTVTPTPAPTPTPTVTPTSTPTITVFNFDDGAPVLSNLQSTPFDQSAGGVTAHFSSTFDPAAFSIQTHETTFYNLSQFSGKYLFQDNVFKTPVDIKFDKTITRISLTFATVDYHDPNTNGAASNIRLTAYMNSATTSPIGSATTQGTFTSDAYPEGTLSFSSSGTPFNFIEIDLPFLPQGATNFLVDNISVTTT